MERRFELRKEELLADCQVHPAVFAGMMERLDQFAEPFAARLRRPEQREHARMYLQGLVVRRGAKERRGDRLSPRRGSAGIADVPGHGPLGSSTPAGGIGAPSGQGTGRAGRRDRFRPVGVSQEGPAFGGRRAAVVRTFGKSRELPSGSLHGLRLAERTRAGGCAVVCSARMDEGSPPPQGMRDSQGTSLSDAP